MRQIVVSALCGFVLVGCESFSFVKSESKTSIPKSLGETFSAHGYVPLDPLPISTRQGNSCRIVRKDGTKPNHVSLPRALPDIAVRFAVARFEGSGSLTFGPVAVTGEGKTYRAILDWINVDEVSQSFLVRKVVSRIGGQREFTTIDSDEKANGYQAILVENPEIFNNLHEDFDKQKSNARFEGQYTLVTIPIYIGVGLRLTADIVSLESGVNLGSMGTIGASADANKLSGTLTLQTLGISGQDIATVMPLPNKLDQTTIETAIMSIGSIRSMMHFASSSGQVRLSPRIVGMYSPIGTESSLVNAIYTEISNKRLEWHRPCEYIERSDRGPWKSEGGQDNERE